MDIRNKILIIILGLVKYVVSHFCVAIFGKKINSQCCRACRIKNYKKIEIRNHREVGGEGRVMGDS